MNNISYLEAGKYVLAVSGGVDSVVLLDILHRNKDLELIVAHVDHGIREDSRDNARFVEKLAQQYNLLLKNTELSLGSNASEETARHDRYSYLRQLQKDTQAKAIITAHHADDVVETMIINLLRGTGWKGICSLVSTDEVKRPFLGVRKQELVSYATEHSLQWYHDSTNDSQEYLRNYVRHKLMPRVSFDTWYDLYEKQLAVRGEIEEEAARRRTYKRHNYIMWPPQAALEVLRTLFPMTRPQAEYLLHAIKTAKPHKEIEVGSGYKVRFNREDFIVIAPST